MGEARVQKRGVLRTLRALLVTGTAYFHGECLRSESRLAQLILAAVELPAVTGGPWMQARAESATGDAERACEACPGRAAADRRAGEAFGKTDEKDDAEAEKFLKEMKLKFGTELAVVEASGSEKDTERAKEVPLQARAGRGFREVPGNRGTLKILEDIEFVYGVFVDPESDSAWGRWLRHRGSRRRLPGG